jgi:hypothetical protein
MKPSIVVWFSCGTASAVTAKLVIAQYAATHDITVARCVVPEEHEDNARFADDCARWFGLPVTELASREYTSCQHVWEKRRFMSGPHGAPCTIEMKKAVRWEFERTSTPDLQAFGYTADETKRARRFRADNPDVRLVTPLIDHGLSKQDCHAIVDRAGVVIPLMYRLGFNNANCVGCVQAQSPSYWNRVRRHFPDVFAARRQLSRELGVRLVKTTRGGCERLFLDELDPLEGKADADPPMDCSLLCHMAESRLA